MTYGFLEKILFEGPKPRHQLHAVEKASPPIVNNNAGALSIACYDPSIGEEVSFETDLLALSCAIVPRDTDFTCYPS